MAPYGANVPGEQLVTVTGWGMLSHTGPRPSILQEITFKTWDNQRCSQTYGSNAPGGITDHMLCAGQKGQDSCMVSKLLRFARLFECFKMRGNMLTYLFDCVFCLF